MKIRHLLGACVVSALLWAAAFSAFAEPIRGLDVLGLAKQNPKMIAEELDYGSAIGFLDFTFGDPYPNLRSISNSGKVVGIRSQLRDFTCYRNNNCPAGTPSQRDAAPIKDGAKRLARFVAAYPNIKCYVSPALEHDVKDKKVVERWYAILKSVVPSCIPVCSAFTGYCPKNVLLERHGNVGTADIRSNDGHSLFDSNSAEYRSSGKYVTLGWINCMNGRVTGEEPGQVPPPLKRVNWCTRAEIRQAVRVMRPVQPKPLLGLLNDCRDIQSPDLFKTNAEYYGKGKDDGRGNKGLFIHRHRHDRIAVVTSSGASIGCLKYYGPFSGGGFRHYLGNCSGQTPVELMDQLRSEWGLLKVGSECRWFNAIRRMGYYR